MKIASLAMWVAGTLVISSCSAHMPSGPITGELTPDKPIDGIPHRVPGRFEAVLYQKVDNSSYAEVYRQHVTVADPYRLEVIGFDALPLSNGTFSAAFNSDNTLKEASIASTTALPNALTQAGAAVTTVTNQIEAVDQAKDAKKAADSAAESAKYALMRKALVNCQAAQTAVAELDLAKSDPQTTELALLAAQHKADIAIFDAATTASEASMPPCQTGL
jgi:hypothetical protein